MPQRLLGLDIGSHSLKAAIVAGGFRGFELLGYAEKERTAYPPDAKPSLGEEIEQLEQDEDLSRELDSLRAKMSGKAAAGTKSEE